MFPTCVVASFGSCSGVQRGTFLLSRQRWIFSTATGFPPPLLLPPCHWIELDTHMRIHNPTLASCTTKLPHHCLCIAMQLALVHRKAIPFNLSFYKGIDVPFEKESNSVQTGRRQLTSQPFPRGRDARARAQIAAQRSLCDARWTIERAQRRGRKAPDTAMDGYAATGGGARPKHGRWPLVEIPNGKERMDVACEKATPRTLEIPAPNRFDSKTFEDAVFEAVDEAAAQAKSGKRHPATPVHENGEAKRSYQDAADNRTASSCAEFDTKENRASGKTSSSAKSASFPPIVQDRREKEALSSLADTKRLRVFLEMVSAERVAVRGIGEALDVQSTLQEILRPLNLPRMSGVTFSLKYHDEVASFLKAHSGCVLVREVPRSTLRGMRIKGAKRATESEVASAVDKIPRMLYEKLLPFQKEGVRRGIAFGGRVLLADAMGVGKTIQAIAMASCFKEEWPLLIVAPASLRLTWADAMERWLPELRPEDIHIVRGKRDALPHLNHACRPKTRASYWGETCPESVQDKSSLSIQRGFPGTSDAGDNSPEQSADLAMTKTNQGSKLALEPLKNPSAVPSVPKCEGFPKVVIASYRTLAMLRKEFVDGDFLFGMMIVDESHRLRTSLTTCSLAEEVEVTASALRKSRRAILLTGTPSLSRPFDIFLQVELLWPGLLGRHPRDFGNAYCSLRWIGEGDNKHIRTSGSLYLNELHILLRETVMIRRTKEEVLGQLPPKRRQVVILDTKASEKRTRAKANRKTHRQTDPSSSEMSTSGNHGQQYKGLVESFEEDWKQNSRAGDLKPHNWYHSLGKQKIAAVRRWILDALVGIPPEDLKVLIFAHHKDVMDGLQNALEELCVSYARIDGSTPSFEREDAVRGFNIDRDALRNFSEQAPKGDSGLLGHHLQVVLISMKAGGTGLDFHSASVVIFAELPLDPATLFQAEDRAHRRGQKKSVNVYFLCAKGTADEEIWSFICRSTKRVSTVSNGIDKCVQGVSIDSVVQGEEKLCPGDESMMHELETSCSTHPSATPLPLESVKDEASKFLYPSDEDIFFKMSENTDRIHLYRRCNKGEDNACVEAALSASESKIFVQPLEKNFRAEELFAASSKPILPAKIAKLATVFVEEWTALRNSQKHMLSMHAVRPPLAELIMKVPITSGIGIRKRKVSLEHVKGALGQPPDKAEWRQLDWICPRRKCHVTVSRPFTKEGGLLCSMCFEEIDTSGEGHNLHTDKKDFFCGRRCFQAFLHRTSGGTLRKAIFDIEHGICQVCGLDAHRLCVRLRPIKSFHERQKLVLDTTAGHPLCPGWSSKTLDRLVSVPSEGHAWQMDHIIEVAAGGGGCGLENVQTLCVPCHSLKTRQYVQTSAQMKRTKRAALERSIQQTLQSMRSTMDSETQMCTSQDPISDDEDLLVDVPGVG